MPALLAHSKRAFHGIFFFRTNRRQILNLGRVEKAALAPSGILTLTLRGREVELSRRQSALLRDIFSI